ncbi:hypothetical protein CALCODRAFT_441735, partial [Calocera cornea HHB12733]
MDFVRRFLHDHLGWSLRHSTKAAHKLPTDWRLSTWKAALRAAYAIQHFNIPPSCIVNSDETQLLLQHGGDCSYAPIGSRQVDVLGKEEKRACTVMTSLSMDGTLLPFQCIWKGEQKRSLPFRDDPRHPIMAKAREHGHIFTLSHSSTYWTNLGTFQTFVRDILVPHFHVENQLFERSKEATCLWVIDVYSVHRGEEFRTWMTSTYPWILIHYIPASCT